MTETESDQAPLELGDRIRWEGGAVIIETSHGPLRIEGGDLETLRDAADQAMAAIKAP